MKDEWSLIRDRWLDIPIGADRGHRAPTWEVFSENFERHLQNVFEYVSPRVTDRDSLERVVTRVLIRSPGLLSGTRDPVDQAQLRTSADLLIAIERSSTNRTG